MKESYLIAKGKSFGRGLIVMASLLLVPWVLHFILYCIPGKGSLLEGKSLYIT